METTIKSSPNLGRWIQEARKNKSLAVAELGKLTETEKSYLHRIESGRVPSDKLLTRIGKVLDVSVEELTRWRSEAGLLSPHAATGVTQPAPPASAGETSRDGAPSEVMQGVREYSQQMRRLLESIPSLPSVDIARIVEQLGRIIGRVLEEWHGKEQNLSRFIPSRGPQHNLGMIEQLCSNLKTELRNLDRNDLRLLVTAVWLHDIGLARTERYEADLGELENYHDYSVAYVDENYLKLGLSDEDRRVVSALCKYHRNVEHLRDVELPGTGVGGVTVDRQQALLALLRLAALLEVRQARVTEGNLLPFTSPIPIDFECELLRNLFVSRIYRERFTLWADLCYDWDAQPAAIDSLRKRIESDLQGALDLIKDALVVDLDLVLLWAKTRPGAPPSADIEPQIRPGLDLVSTSRSPNAARVIETLMGSLRGHFEHGERETALEKIKGELKTFEKLRFYQAQIPNLIDDLDALVNCRDSSRELDERLTEMQEIVHQYEASKEQAYQWARTVAQKIFTEPARFVAFGYSSCVLDALGSIAPAVKAGSYVYVFECRPKSHQGFDGSLEYCDGIEYARGFRKRGYRQVLLTPDGSASVVMNNRLLGEDERLPTFVVLGAEGIDTSGEIASTIGSMAVVLAAYHAVPRIPVYVLAEGGKIRPNIEQKGLRDNLWLTSTKRVTELRKDQIEVRNLVNEKIPGDLFKGIIGLSPGGPLDATPVAISAAYEAHRASMKKVHV